MSPIWRSGLKHSLESLASGLESRFQPIQDLIDSRCVCVKIKRCDNDYGNDKYSIQVWMYVLYIHTHKHTQTPTQAHT